ncbi:PHD finger protein Alfin1 [Artemisia annua]|uniref:PHD finger protein ALFIN-LIKE n=1 Tax=Artemisia annua TaxID=35608 RepID=A0A2U1QGN0_ARTAN|nr:PHD finger protein Alfin1 [Artemisia annua]
MQETDWLSLVAFHSDSWLVSIASYLGARSTFGKKERKRLFQMMNDLPTVFEVVSGKVEKQKSEAEIQHNGNKSKSKSEAEIQQNGNKRKSKSEAEIQHNGYKSKSTEIYTGKSLPSGLKMTQQPEYEELIGEEENDEQETSLCGACGDNYANDQFWICCDICEKWFHGKCVKMTPSKAKNVKRYRCPYCPIKRGRLQA